jgi:hypothetical protein
MSTSKISFFIIYTYLMTAVIELSKTHCFRPQAVSKHMIAVSTNLKVFLDLLFCSFSMFTEIVIF